MPDVTDAQILEFCRKLKASPEEVPLEEYRTLMEHEAAETVFGDPETGPAWQEVYSDGVKAREALQPPKIHVPSPDEVGAPTTVTHPIAEVADRLGWDDLVVATLRGLGIQMLEDVARLSPDNPPESFREQFGAVNSPTMIRAAIGLVQELAGSEASEPLATAAGAAEPTTEAPIFQLVEASARQREEFGQKMQQAYADILAALADERLMLDPGAEFVDQDRDRAQKAITWMQIRVAKGEMTIEEVVAYAKEQDWTEELAVRPDIYKAMIAAFGKAELFLVRRARVGDQEVDVRTELGQAIEREEITVEQAVEMAKKAGWTRSDGPRRGVETIGDIMRAKAVAEDDDDRRRDGGGKRGRGRRNRR